MELTLAMRRRLPATAPRLWAAVARWVELPRVGNGEGQRGAEYGGGPSSHMLSPGCLRDVPLALRGRFLAVSLGILHP